MEIQSSRLAVIGLCYPFRGGISHFSTLLVRALRVRHEVEFITLTRQYPEFLFPGKTQYDTSSRTLVESNEPIIDSLNPVSWIKTARALNDSQPDLIVIQWWHPFFAPAFGTIVRLLKRPLQKRVCFLCHNVLPHEPSPLQKLLTRYAFEPARLFIVHSKEDGKNLETLHPGAIIRKGCHPRYSEFGEAGAISKREARRALELPEQMRTILFFGLVRPYKGLAHLIRAMKTVTSQFECRLLIVGEFYDDKEPYLDLIENHGLADCITVVDEYVPNEQVAAYFAAADVVVLPYVSATQSGIVQIAFALETPVITTNVGGLPEAVEHGKTGLVVDAESPRQLADAILKYYSENLELQFGDEIRRQAERFDWNAEIRQIEAFLAAPANQIRI